MPRKNKRAKACAISTKSRRLVNERDGNYCVYCKRYSRYKELAHVFSRAQGGRGIPENLVTLGGPFDCECHYEFDHGTRQKRQAMKKRFIDYLKGHHPDWTKKQIIYDKWGESP